MVQFVTVTPQLARLFCDKCKTVEMQYELTYTSMPPTYLYECPQCHEHITKKNLYPTIVYADSRGNTYFWTEED